jgi:hypothetical protein
MSGPLRSPRTHVRDAVRRRSGPPAACRRWSGGVRWRSSRWHYCATYWIIHRSQRDKKAPPERGKWVWVNAGKGDRSQPSVCARPLTTRAIHFCGVPNPAAATQARTPRGSGGRAVDGYPTSTRQWCLLRVVNAAPMYLAVVTASSLRCTITFDSILIWTARAKSDYVRIIPCATCRTRAARETKEGRHGRPAKPVD